MTKAGLFFVLQIVLFSSCSSGGGDKYELLTKIDKQNIDSFCVCTQPFQPFFEKMEKLNDSAEAISMLDSISLVMKEFMNCIGYLKNLDSKPKNQEKEKQVLAYIKDKHPKCLSLVQGEKETEKESK